MAARELANLEEYLNTVEEYLNLPYVWDEYNIVIMPPSFPMGGINKFNKKNKFSDILLFNYKINYEESQFLILKVSFF